MFLNIILGMGDWGLGIGDWGLGIGFSIILYNNQANKTVGIQVK